MKRYIHNTKKRFVSENVFDQQSLLEILMYEIRKLSIRHSKVIAKVKRKRQQELKIKLKTFEKSFLR